MSEPSHENKKSVKSNFAEHSSDSFKERQSSEKARQNGTHPDEQEGTCIWIPNPLSAGLPIEN